MAAVTADTYSSTRVHNDITEETHPIASGVTVYTGALACFNAAGALVSATDAAAQTFAGEVFYIVNDSGDAITAGTGNATGSVKARIRHGHQMLLNVDTPARSMANLTKTVFVLDNVTVTNALTAANDIPVGQVTEFVDSMVRAWVKLTRGTASS